MENGSRVRGFGFRIDFPVIRIDGNPGSSVCKACLRRIVPLHRRSGVVPAFKCHAGPESLVRQAAAFTPFFVGIDAFDIAEVVRALERIIGHAQFFALINIGRALHHMQTGGQHFGGNFPVLRSVVSKPGNGAWLVMIVPEKAVPCFAV